LAVLDGVGEAASLSAAERITILDGLVAHGVPASKILVGIKTSTAADALGLAARARQLGMRGVLIPVPVTGRMLPPSIIPASVQEIIRQIDKGLHLHLSISAPASATQACLTAIETLLTQMPSGLCGIRDEGAGCALGLAVLERFRGHRLDVYTADDRMLPQLIQRGGAGLIGGGPNLLGRLHQHSLQSSRNEAAAKAQRAVDVAVKSLGGRPLVPAIKALLARNTGRTEWYKVRLPLRTVSVAERASLFEAFDRTGAQLTPVTGQSRGSISG
jgi:4-hydroxy-tetrahydrodipicolinate synthase